MADQKLVDQLQNGSAEWNRRRPRSEEAFGSVEQRRRPLLDLSYTDLRNKDLKGFDLHWVNLTETNLADADLTGADLRGAVMNGAKSTAILTDANLSGAFLHKADLSPAILLRANLSGADLFDAKLEGSDLRGADLSGAILTHTYLREAQLSGANLSGAELVATDLSDIDLSGVIGSETCRHWGPSVIDFQTLVKSYPLPLEFLRGVGLPDNLIEYLPSLLNQPIQYYSCFISYSSKNDDFAKRIHADLQSKGVRCWFAPHDLPIGGKMLDEIDAAIRLRDRLVLILSEDSIQSGWVEDEVLTAYEEERRRGQTVLFPIRLDDAVTDTKAAWASKLRANRNIGDFRQWKDHDHYQKGLERVLRDLSAGLKKSG